MGTDIKMIIFKLGHEEYGVEVDKVKTIERMVPITRVPKTPAFVKGVINLRGTVIPVIDLRGRFDLEETPYTSQSRIIIVSLNELEVGLIVDVANDVIDLNTDQIESPPDIVVGGIQAKYLQGIVKLSDERLLIIMDLVKVLNKDEWTQLEQVKE